MTDVVPDVAPVEGPAVPEPSTPSNVVELPSGQKVTLRPEVSIPLGIAALSVIKQGGSQAVIEAGLAEVYLHFGIEDWTFPVPVTPENIERLLPYSRGGLEVAERADALYSETVMRPLVARLSALSNAGRQASTTRPIPLRGSRRPTRSGPSSRSGTAGSR